MGSGCSVGPYYKYTPPSGHEGGIQVQCRFCFSSDSKMIVLRDSREYEVTASEIKKDDLVLTLNGAEKVFTKVKENIKNEGVFQFYIFKIQGGKSLAVTGNHMMIVFGKDQNDIKLKFACQLKVGDLLRTKNGFCEIYEIETKMMNDSYQIIAENGTVLANDILVSTLYQTEGKNRKENMKILDSAKIPIEIKN